MAAVSNEALGIIDNFELAVAHLLPERPVADKVNNKRNTSQIYGVGGELRTGTGPETGVELRYYKPHELFKLTAEEVAELARISPTGRR